MAQVASVQQCARKINNLHGSGALVNSGGFTQLAEKLDCSSSCQ